MNMISCLGRSLLFMLLLLSAFAVRAQRYIGIATSGWSSINSLYLNPASIAGSREKISIGILSTSIVVDNNLGKLPKLPNITATVNGNTNIFLATSNKAFDMIAPAAVVRGPGIVVAVVPKLSLALTTGIRGFNQFHNFDPAFYTAFTTFRNPPTAGYAVSMRNFNWTAHMWSEIGISIAGVVREEEKYSISLGATIRHLGGLGYLSVRGKSMDISFDPSTNNFNSAKSYVDFGTNVLTDSSLVFDDMTPRGFVNKFFNKTAGSGESVDLGFTFKYRIGEAELSDYMESTHTHDITFSSAITDLGAITYFNSASAGVRISGDGDLSGSELAANATDLASLKAYARSRGFALDTQLDAKRVYLPTALVTSIDVQVYGRFYANLLYIANLANRMNFGNAYYDQFTFSPRYDYHKMTISLPITYSKLANDTKMGFAVRYTGFYIGSDDFLALIRRRQYGFGVYVGGYVPIFKMRRDPTGFHWK